MKMENKYNFIPAGTWVRGGVGDITRYVTKANRYSFEDDGKLSGMRPADNCHYINYRPLNPQELSDKLTELAGKKKTWDDMVFDASEGWGDKKKPAAIDNFTQSLYQMWDTCKKSNEKTFINPPEPWKILKITCSDGEWVAKHGFTFDNDKLKLSSFGDFLLKSGGKITSVKRTSDGVVFKIGDQTQFGEIDKFDPHGAQMWVQVPFKFVLLSVLNHSKDKHSGPCMNDEGVMGIAPGYECKNCEDKRKFSESKHQMFLDDLKSNWELKDLERKVEFYTGEIKKILDRNMGKVVFMSSKIDKYNLIDMSLDKNITEFLQFLTEAMDRIGKIRMEILNKHYTKA